MTNFLWFAAGYTSGFLFALVGFAILAAIGARLDEKDQQR